MRSEPLWASSPCVAMLNTISWSVAASLESQYFRGDGWTKGRMDSIGDGLLPR